MAQLSTKRWVVDDISDAALFDPVTGDPVGVFERLQQINIQIPLPQTRVYGGTGKYAFHLTENDVEASISLQNAVLDFNQLVAATGADLSTGATVVPAMEKHTVDTAGTITLKHAAEMVAESEKIIVATKGLTNSGKILERVAASPTADQYTIESGVVTFGDTNLKGKDVRVFYEYTATQADVASIKTTTKNKPYKFVAYGRAFDDELNEYFDVAIVVYKAQMLGTFAIDQQRKTATANTLELAVLDPGRSDEKVIDIYAV